MKIGIMTFYYKNYNYGGILQACALQYYFEDKMNECVQISFQDIKNRKRDFKERIKENLQDGIGVLLKKLRIILIKKLRYSISDFFQKTFFPEYREEEEKWKSSMGKFMNIIPHTKEIYNHDTILQSVQQFECMVCGSDQVWNPLLADPYLYALGFVKGVKKFSYAASIARDRLDEAQLDKLCQYAKELDYISLREENNLEILSKKMNKSISVVLDPTLLLTRKQWEEVADYYKSKNKRYVSPCIDEKYIFVYLLGDNKRHRKVVSQLAQKMLLKIVYIPYVIPFSKTGHLSDRKFGDYRLNDVDPLGFVEIIKKAEVVVTDSFHATVFSLIYHKEFYCLQRALNKGNMNSRLDSLLKSIDLQERLLMYNLKCINQNAVSEETWDSVDDKLDKLRLESIQFLNQALL